jgi:hypothetical protein
VLGHSRSFVDRPVKPVETFVRLAGDHISGQSRVHVVLAAGSLYDLFAQLRWMSEAWIVCAGTVHPGNEDAVDFLGREADGNVHHAHALALFGEHPPKSLAPSIRPIDKLVLIVFWIVLGEPEDSVFAGVEACNHRRPSRRTVSIRHRLHRSPRAFGEETPDVGKAVLSDPFLDQAGRQGVEADDQYFWELACRQLAHMWPFSDR